jgi:diacylglycerol kinase family enzyme
MTSHGEPGKGPWRIIVNPASANGRTGRRWGRTAVLLRRLLPPFEANLTTAPQQAGELACRAAEQGVETIGIHGGDGTVNEVINGLLCGPVRQDTVLALLPSGTGADLVRSLGLSHSLPRAAQQMFAGPSLPAWPVAPAAGISSMWRTSASGGRWSDTSIATASG